MYAATFMHEHGHHVQAGLEYLAKFCIAFHPHNKLRKS